MKWSIEAVRLGKTWWRKVGIYFIAGQKGQLRQRHDVNSQTAPSCVPILSRYPCLDTVLDEHDRGFLTVSMSTCGSIDRVLNIAAAVFLNIEHV